MTCLVLNLVIVTNMVSATLSSSWPHSLYKQSHWEGLTYQKWREGGHLVSSCQEELTKVPVFVALVTVPSGHSGEMRAASAGWRDFGCLLLSIKFSPVKFAVNS